MALLGEEIELAEFQATSGLNNKSQALLLLNINDTGIFVQVFENDPSVVVDVHAKNWLFAEERSSLEVQ